MRKIVLTLIVSMVYIWPADTFAATTPVDSLIGKLVDKGILTKSEARELKVEILEDGKAIQEDAIQTQTPSWVKNLKVGGDFRARLQTERKESGAGASQGERVRGRMRARLNFDTKVNDQARVVIGIATDGGGARSSNYTYSTGTPFSKPNVVLNKAYGQYMVNDKLTLTAGKMDNSIWEPMEFLWDGDYTPEGGVVQYNYKLNDMISVFSLGSLFALGEFNPSTSDPFMFVGQGGVMLKPNSKFDAKAAVTYTGYGNIKSGFTGGTANNTANTANGATGLKYDYSAPMGAIDIGINNPFGDMLPVAIPRIGTFGQYTQNPGAPDKNVAWMIGAYIGDAKVAGWGTWKITGAYKFLAKDAWLDIFPDSDFYGGNTGVKGVEAILEVGLAKNMTFAFDYYRARRIGSTVAKAPEHVVQYDFNWKF